MAASGGLKTPEGNGPKRRRRTKAAEDLEHLIPGGKNMTDAELEIALDLIIPGWRNRK
jgi:hypothetical protein